MDDPKQLLGDQAPRPKPLAGTLKLFDINILPDRYRRRKFRLINALPWLVLIVLLGTLYPAALSAIEAEADFRRKQTELTDLQLALSNNQIAADEMARIQSEIDARLETRDQIQDSYQGIDFNGTNWSELLFQINSKAPTGISWTQITQVEDQISLEGIASNYLNILILQDSLAELDGIYSVSIESVEQFISDTSSAAPPDTDTGDGNPGQSQPYLFSVLIAVNEGGVK